MALAEAAEMERRIAASLLIFMVDEMGLSETSIPDHK